MGKEKGKTKNNIKKTQKKNQLTKYRGEKRKSLQKKKGGYNDSQRGGGGGGTGCGGGGRQGEKVGRGAWRGMGLCGALRGVVGREGGVG